MSLAYNKKNTILAKNLRKYATPQEKKCGMNFFQNTRFVSKGKKQLMILL